MKAEDFFPSLSLPAFACMVEQSLSHPQLVRLCHEIGVEVHGYRLEKIPLPDLIGHLYQDLQKDPRQLLPFQNALDLASQQTLESIQKTNPNQIRAFFKNWGELLDRGVLGPLLWAVWRDGRKAVNRMGEKINRAFIEEARALEGGIEPAKEAAGKNPEGGEAIDEESSGEIRKIVSDCRDLQREWENCLRILEKLLKRSSAEAQKAKELAKKRLEEVREKEGTITRLGTELAGLQAELINARRLTASQRADEKTADLASRLHALERDLRIARHDIQKKDEALREVEDLRRKIEEYRLTINLAEREKKQAEDRRRELEEEVDLLQEKAHALETAKKPPAVARPRREEERLGIFVDSQNIYYTVRDFFGGARVNYDELLTRIAQGRKVVRSLAYVVQADFGEQEPFFQMLQFKGFQVKRRPLKVRSDHSMKGNWDMGMAMDLIRFSDDLDTVALVSGDGDFTDLVGFLKRKGVRIEIYGVEPSTAWDLKKAADSFTPINADWLLKSVPQ